MINNFDNLRISEDVEKINDEILNICAQMEDELNNSEYAGITASLIGYEKRIIALKFEDKIEFLINPLITKKKKEDYQVVKQKDLFSNQYYIIPRFKDIEIFYTNKDKQVQKIDLKGDAAYFYQQLNDLLGGLLIEDYGMPIDDDFDDLTDDEKGEIVEQYLKSFEEAKEFVQSEIDKDPQLHDIQKTLAFIDSVNKGETKLAPRQPNRETRRRMRRQAKQLNKLIKKDNIVQ